MILRLIFFLVLFQIMPVKSQDTLNRPMHEFNVGASLLVKPSFNSSPKKQEGSFFLAYLKYLDKNKYLKTSVYSSFFNSPILGKYNGYYDVFLGIGLHKYKYLFKKGNLRFDYGIELAPMFSKSKGPVIHTERIYWLGLMACISLDYNINDSFRIGINVSGGPTIQNAVMNTERWHFGAYSHNPVILTLKFKLK